MDKPSVNIETSIVSYLAADPSRHPVTLRNQQLTHAWWNAHRERYALYTSNVVEQEIAQGDPVIARRRLDLLSRLPVLSITDAARTLATALGSHVPLPVKAKVDALHIALATVHNLSYLLTWDSRHIANPALFVRIEGICGVHGYSAPVLCTPADLMKGE